MGGKYCDSVPLFKGTTGIQKLCQLAVPLAALAGSWRFEDDQYHLVVDQEHVGVAAWDLERRFDDDLGYYAYSKVQFQRTQLLAEAKLWEFLEGLGDEQAGLRLAHYFLAQEYVTRHGLTDRLGGGPTRAANVLSRLLEHQCFYEVPGKSGVYARQPAFVEALRRYIEGKEAEGPE